MLYSLARTDGARWRGLIVVAGTALLILAAVASYSLLAHRHETPTLKTDAHAVEGSGQTAVDDPAREPRLAPVPVTADPEGFARGVAEALFAWDTDTPTMPTDLTERLVAVADPTGGSSAGLVADIANYLPTTDSWAALRRYETRQWIEVTSVEVPSRWPTAVRQAGPDGLLPGTTAYTIRGVRRRSGMWEGAPVSTAHDVAFTVFIVCRPSYPACHLLRLSRLDEPLD